MPHPKRSTSRRQNRGVKKGCTPACPEVQTKKDSTSIGTAKVDAKLSVQSHGSNTPRDQHHPALTKLFRNSLQPKNVTPEDDTLSQSSTAAGSSRATSDGSPSPATPSPFSPWHSPPTQKELGEPAAVAESPVRGLRLRHFDRSAAPPIGGLTQEELD